MNGGGSTPVREARAPVGQMLGIGAIATALGITLALVINWFPKGASTQAGPIDTLWDVLLIVSVPVFVLVVTIVGFSVVRYRMRPGEELLDGPPIHGNTRLEVIWTAIPATLLVALCTYAYIVLTNVEEAKANTMDVRVVGEQFEWTYYYKAANGKDVLSHQLYLPKDRPVRFTVESKDVLHDFWVPAFRMKIDAVRGIQTHIRVTPNRVGDYPVICAELCGLGHAAMRSDAHVVSPQEFQTWLSKLQSTAGGAAAPAGTPAPSGAAPDGKALFASSGCTGCHTLADAGATGTVGPNLDKAIPTLTPAFIKQSIEDPNAVITKGYTAGIMPGDFKQRLGDAGVTAVVQYLKKVAKP